MLICGEIFQVPLTRNVIELIAPVAALGLAVGMVETSMLPELSYLVDVRHSIGYAGAYAVGDLALCLGDTIGNDKFVEYVQVS